VLTVNGAAELINRSFPQTNEAIARLTDAGALSQVTIGKRNRAFEAKEIINAFTDLERQLASPGLIPAVRSRAGRYHPGAGATYQALSANP
jgi:hypothetical protein